MNPVDVFPTIEQIETATRAVRYGDIVRPNNSSCPISLDTFNEDDNVTIIRQCGHIFKIESLNIWFQNNCACPVCRYDIREYVQENVWKYMQYNNFRQTYSFNDRKNLIKIFR